MPEDLKQSQIGSSSLPPPFRGLHSPGVRKTLSNYLRLLFPGNRLFHSPPPQSVPLPSSPVCSTPLLPSLFHSPPPQSIPLPSSPVCSTPLLPSLFHSPPPQSIENQAPIHHPKNQLYASCCHPWMLLDPVLLESRLFMDDNSKHKVGDPVPPKTNNHSFD